MILSLKVTNYLGESIIIGLRNPEESGFFVRDITGISSPKATINTTDLLVEDGSVINSTRAQQRNILLTIGLTDSPSVEENRHLLYKFFPVKRPIILEIESEKRTVLIYGLVESNDVGVFTKTETAIISVICPQPYFESGSKQITDVSFVMNYFEFPFSNESLVSPLLEFGRLRTNQDAIIDYPGDSQIGILITITFNGLATNITIFEANSNKSLTINTSKIEDVIEDTIAIGDQIFLSTVKGNKHIEFSHLGHRYNILNALERDSDWLEIKKGINIFGYTAETGADNLSVVIENKVLYEGV